jgi:hypothetical protein
MRRVARSRVVIVTYDSRVSGVMWLMAEYLSGVAALDHGIFPIPERLAEWLGGRVAVEPLPIHRDSPDWMLGPFWAHPERELDAEARAATPALRGFRLRSSTAWSRRSLAISRTAVDTAGTVRSAHLRNTTRASASSCWQRTYANTSRRVASATYNLLIMNYSASVEWGWRRRGFFCGDFPFFCAAEKTEKSGICAEIVQKILTWTLG